MDINAVNALTYEEFLEIFGNVVEKCPIILAAIWSNHPFRGIADIEAQISDFIDSLPESGKEGILRCHPDLSLPAVSLTRDSVDEQRAAGLVCMDSGERTLLLELCARYRQRFGFPFVICARANSVESIGRALRERVNRERAQERERGIEEVKKICSLRLRQILQPHAERSTNTTKL
ncbi:2-oxo-4-hydroxy-4-carboxy-5-ureidoimidazoline decarboxylase [Pygocentrus nattereri]|uniref:2-oxo-4-hydroxy-4-carboxy-5-ureidoimidazoline decarboxylase n=1 Tax=Pygocentrus nattereri TaxID=42514 RepID=A0AAR2LX55_PYGNA|nr:2-oxo-4-hydroxy-4-carboxy-5-ureidoimidazoline decarboxylase [Pygocentrus nattereri]